MERDRSECLVLEVRDYRESSLLVTLLTRQHGRRTGVVKGAKRAKSSLAGALQPFALVRAEFLASPSGGLVTLTGADVMERRRYARLTPGAGDSGSLVRLACAGVYAEVLTLSAENDPHAEELFDLAAAFFRGLDEAEHPGSWAVSGFFALLGALGYMPDLRGVDREESQPVYQLDVHRGELSQGAASVADGRVRLDREAVEVLARVASQAGVEDDLVVNRRVGKTLLRLAVLLFETQLERRLKSRRFLEEMVLAEDPSPA